MLKVLHTGDLHLDTAFASLDERQAQIRKNELRAAFTSMMTYARMNGMDVIVEIKSEEGHKHDNAVYVSKSGCQGFCQQGPLMHIEPEHILYTKVKVDDVKTSADIENVKQWFKTIVAGKNDAMIELKNSMGYQNLNAVLKDFAEEMLLFDDRININSMLFSLLNNQKDITSENLENFKKFASEFKIDNKTYSIESAGHPFDIIIDCFIFSAYYYSTYC